MTAKCKPFVKWVGGKTQLLSPISSMYPTGLGSSIDTYVEPFVGGGAVLFDILSKYELSTVFISDTNMQLVNAYRQIRDNVGSVIALLSDYQKRWDATETKEQEAEIYYACRDIFNENITNPDSCDVRQAAAFIFLNRTCFNGLYRVNKKGLFNASLGNYTRPTICDTETLLAVSEALQDVVIRNCSYAEYLTLPINFERSFFFLDPPYLPLSEHSGSKTYSPEMWTRQDHILLASFVKKLRELGAYILMTNADLRCTDAEDSFLDDLYDGFFISRIPAKRRVSKTVEGRKEVTEMLIASAQANLLEI